MKKLLIVIVIGAAMMSSSCQKGFLTSLANNPNAPTTAAATPQLVLPATLTSIINITNGVNYQSEGSWMGYWMYSPGYSFNSGVENYVMTQSGPQHWDDYYGVLTNLNFIVDETNGNHQYANYNAIANILEAVCFKNLVDLYNDVPYSNALEGQGDFYPSYDNGSDIYDSLVLKLDNAMDTINANLNDASVNLPANDDIMFGGDMTQWLEFANTLKLKMLVQQSAVSSKQSYLSTEAAKTASFGYLTQDALVNPGYSISQPSPMYGGFGLGASGAINSQFTFIVSNQTAIDFYKKTNDVRLGYFCAANGVYPNNPAYNTVNLPLNFSDYAANYLGNQASISGGGSGIGPGLIQSPDQSAVMMLAAESYFVQAEATVYGWLPGGAAAAQTLYQDGITASYEYLNVGGSTASADTYAAAYYNQSNVSFVSFPLTASSDSLIHIIIEQKWAALNGISNVEAYDDWRRTYNSATNTGYPIVPVSISPSNSEPHMPFRYYYPTEETTSNGASWKAAGGNTIDPFNDKIFWMP
jgi:Starch-binding associating with outer membrane